MPQRHRPRTPAAPDPAVGTEIELELTGVAHGGVMVARHEGRVVFVADGIPGERVRARVTAAKKSFWRADVVEVLRPSPHRREHVWPEASVDRDPAERAGGAEFGHIALAHQRELKRQVVADALARFAHLEREVMVQALPGDDEGNGIGWRTRVRLHVSADGAVGPYSARSHTVVPVRSLPLAAPAIAEAAPLGARLSDAASVDLIAPSTGGAISLVTGRDGRGPRREPIVERVGEREFRLPADGFWQVHRLAAQTLTDAVRRAVDPDRVDPAADNLDLYGGVGLLAAAFGDAFGRSTRITSVESNPEATEFAGRNLADWVGARAETGRVEQWLRGRAARATAAERARQRAATVVLDPPRAGAGKAVVDELLALAPAQLVYVACDPVAFARDAALFAAGGYEVRALEAFDLFPHTHHLELVASLTPAHA
ncbi:class I SAM-dependent RNA methyltransferase [Gryllotalpicola ginsengisoli]|uniref:class I SAM-dependent RNA methyltransferase n=1 Tax=Gryllotalpicola ginsengisoli TaxID=444608 RepID=UPI0003B454CC|nr:TRAM domain-containing protein [Gryllotalpicola ginsengisoli]